MFYKVIVISFYLGVVESISHCQKVTVSQEFWKNEGVAVIYVMKSTQQNWQSQVSSLVHLKNNVQNIGVNLQLTIATNKNCSAFRNVKYFKVEADEIWKTLEHHNDYPEAFVIDRCGKVTYHIIFPWSLIKWFPFVKGAILSTFFDKPCGPCDSYHKYQVDVPKDPARSEEIKLYPKMAKDSQVDGKTDSGVPPIEIIIKEKHKHKGSDEIFEYTEMELGNTHYHKHFHSFDDEEFMSYDEDHTEFPKKEGMLILESTEKSEESEHHFKHATHKRKRVITKSEEQSILPSVEPVNLDIDKKINEIALLCKDSNDFDQDSKYYGKLFHNLLQAMYSSEETLNSNENEKKEKLTNHYEKLNNWISYIV